MTWADFQQQYQALGRDKADGYFPGHFEGMTAGEISHARSMLETRGVAGDTTDLDGLRLIGDAHTVEMLVAAERFDGLHGTTFEAQRRETLFALTGDPADLQPLLRLTDGAESRDAAFAAQAIARHPLPASFSAPLAERITDGRHEAALLWLVKAWLSAHSVPIWQVPVFDQHLSSIRSVTHATPSKRPALLTHWGTAHPRKDQQR